MMTEKEMDAEGNAMLQNWAIYGIVLLAIGVGLWFVI